MPWPIAGDYNDTIQFPKTCFGDPDLKTGVVKMDRFGLPVASSGMFASVYEMRTPSGRWAVKCFLKPVEDHRRRYAAISTHLKNARLNSAVRFEFIPQGIRVRSEWYPSLKMEWVDGEPLNSYITKNLSQPHRLLQLTREWVELMASLRAAGIGHGDLQHGNVLVTSAGIKLIDYDGMYVPSLAGFKSNEVGHRNYQHPGRTGHDFGPYIDNFSAWVIFCSITAVALDPRLWQILNGGDECLLLRSDDFQRPNRSRAFQVLESSRPEVRALAGQLKAMLSMPIRQVPALDGKVVVQPSAARVQTTTAGPVPSWLTDHVRTPAAGGAATETRSTVEEGPATVIAADWIVDHLVDRQGPVPTLQTHSFALERSALLLTLCVSFVTGWAVSIRMMPIFMGDVLIAVTVCGFAVLLIAQYRKIGGVVERGITSKRLTVAKGILESRQANVKAMELNRKNLLAPLDALEVLFHELPKKINEEMRGVQARIERIRASFGPKRQELADEEAIALRKVEQEFRSRLSALQMERAGLDQQERQELAAELKSMQDARLNIALTNATIDAAILPGIGPKLKANLKAGNIFSARDIEYWRVRNISGIGDSKARHLVE